jgi:hypothetical protein
LGGGLGAAAKIKIKKKLGQRHPGHPQGGTLPLQVTAIITSHLISSHPISSLSLFLLLLLPTYCQTLRSACLSFF